MATDLNDIFPGVALGRPMHRDHDLVDYTLALDDLAELLPMRLGLRRLRPAPKDLVGNIDCTRAG
jgi:hypothetical protein